MAPLREVLVTRGPAILPGSLDRGLTKDRDGIAGNVWETLSRELDPADFRPKLADDVEVKIFRLRWGNDYAMIANPRRLLHFQLEVWEAELAQLMDGTKSAAELVVERLEETGDLDPDAVSELILFLRREGFLDPQPLDVPSLVATALRPRPRWTHRLGTFIKTLRLDWTGAHGHVDWWYRTLLRPFFTPAGVIVSGVFAFGGFAAFLVAQSGGRYSLGTANDAALDSVLLLLLSLVLVYFHELGHAVALVHYSRRIKSAGFMLYFGSPAFFVDASDGLMLERRGRIVESAAGPYAQMAVGGALSFLLLLFPDSAIAPLLFRFGILNYFLVFENLIPLLELDGYFILAETIEVPDLRERSLQFVQHEIWHKLRTREGWSKQEIGLLLYSVIGVAFTVFSVYVAIFFWQQIFGGLIRGLWRGGLGSRLLLLLLAIVLTGPAIRGLIGLVRATFRRVRAVARKIRFRFETSWRVEAAELIDALPAFEDLPEGVLSDLAGRVRLKGYRPGEPVFRQGERAVAFYVVRNGTLRVEEEDPDSGDTAAIRTLTRGDSFGELGLLGSAPRAATVRAFGQVELFEVDEPTFDRLLAESITAPEFKLTLQTMAELREIAAFTALGTEGLGVLLEHGSWVTATPGESLVEEGATGDAFFAIRSGQADVLRGGERIRTIGPGDHFGEIALLKSVPRTATVSARTPVRAFRLDRQGFDLVMRDAFREGTIRQHVDKTWQH